MKRFCVLTLFPEVLEPYFGASILGRAQKAGIISISCHNIRDYTLDKHRKVDDTPYGGGYGMIMTPQPIIDCHKDVTSKLTGSVHTVYLSPQGSLFRHEKALELREYDNLVFLCGHYEGVDERALDAVVDEEISVGDYVLTGGELPCALIIDAVSRLIDGVLPDKTCYEAESIASGLLEYPQYTKPAEYEGRKVPEVLLGGDHAAIVRFQREASLKKTAGVRPELLENAQLDKQDILYLEKLRIDHQYTP